MNVPLLDLKAQYATIKSEVDAAIAEVLESQHFILGPKVEQCEKAIAAYSQLRPRGSASPRAATPCSPVSWPRTSGPATRSSPRRTPSSPPPGAIARVGAIPVFVDIDPVTYNLDPAQIAAKVTARTRAIIPVHLYGQMADMDAVMARGGRRTASSSSRTRPRRIGAEYKGRRAGSIGHYGCFSFFPSKNLGACGRRRHGRHQRCAARGEAPTCLRGHGSKPKYYHKIIGGNFRLDALQAAVVSAKLPHLDAWTAARQRNAKRYDRAPWRRAAVPIGLPAVVTDRHIFNQYVIRVSGRDELQAYLKQKGIGTEVYYPVPMHLQECFAYLGYSGRRVPRERAGGARKRSRCRSTRSSPTSRPATSSTASVTSSTAWPRRL